MHLRNRRRLRAFLQHHTTLVLATADAGGSPWASTLFYVADPDLGLTFVSMPQSRHALNLAARPYAAAAVNTQHTHWRTVLGVQVEGETTLLGDERRERALRQFSARFPWLRDLRRSRDPDERAIGESLAAANVYRLAPNRLVLIDNARGFATAQTMLVGETLDRA